MNYEKDILLDENDDLVINGGDFVVDESYLQEVGIILRLNTGELKSDPVLAPNLIQLVKTKAPQQEFEERVRVYLARDNKNYDDAKGLINLKSL